MALNSPETVNQPYWQRADARPEGPLLGIVPCPVVHSLGTELSLLLQRRLPEVARQLFAELVMGFALPGAGSPLQRVNDDEVQST